MKCLGCLGSTVLITFLLATSGEAQTHSDDPLFRPTVFAPEVKKSDLKIEPAAPPRTSEHYQPVPGRAGHFPKKQFLILSGAVYGASFLDMHQTLKERKYNWWYESDPLAKPFVRLPAPAYYATGFALATCLNWVSWKMGHSRRWHRLAVIPQLAAIGGNTYGYKTNLF